MSVATANKDGKKRQYKDYVHFLDNYKQGKPDCISEDSTEMSGRSFKDYLESYNTKLYQPVQPTFKKDTTTVKKEDEKLVKTEVFLQIDNETTTARRITKTFHLNGHDEKTIEPSTILRHTNSFNQNSVHQEENNIYENTKKSLRKTPSLKEKRRVFEENQEKITKPQRTELTHNKNNVISNIIKKQEDKACTSKPPSRSSEKIHVEESSHPTVAELTLNKNNVISNIIKKQEDKACVQSKPPSRSSEKNHLEESAHPTVAIKNNAVTKTSQIAPTSCFIPPPAPPQPKTSAFAKVPTKPVVKVIKISQSEATGSPGKNPVDEIIQPEIIETNAVTKPLQTPPNSSSIPPPPPLPPATVKSFTTTKPVACSKPVASSKPVSGLSSTVPGRNTLPKRQSDSTDAVPRLDKTDPRVKKAVYGALRDMYGTYHDKANDYLATLPKSRVKKNNGLDSIINSIASQGGLDKLSGRMNPKLEVE